MMGIGFGPIRIHRHEVDISCPNTKPTSISLWFNGFSISDEEVFAINPCEDKELSHVRCRKAVVAVLILLSVLSPLPWLTK